MISSANYKTISDYIDSCIYQEYQIYDNFYNIYVNLDTIDSVLKDYYTTDFKNYINGVYLTSYQPYIYNPKSLFVFVFALQEHIRKNYGDINDYLTNNSIKVKSYFADLSEKTGFVIDNGNIE